MNRRVGAILIAGGALFGCTESTNSSPESLSPLETTISPTLPIVTSPETTVTTTILDSTTTIAPIACTYEVESGDYLSTIADKLSTEGSQLRYQDIAVENAIEADNIYPGQILDVCINGLNDVLADGSPIPTTTTTTTTLPPTPETTVLAEPTPETTIPVEVGSGVTSVQQHSNNILVPYGFPALETDGNYGKLSQQATCMARVMLGLPATRAQYAEGSPEERDFLTRTNVVLPEVTKKYPGKWTYVSETCQAQILGEGQSVVMVTEVSTGGPENDTRNGEYATYLYRPAIDNGGWHNSSDFPAAEDNPLNGNMYEPKYFSDGQALHGANSVPTSPASKGCVRTTVEVQDFITSWLGLDNVQEKSYWDIKAIGLTVIIDGAYEYDI